MIWPLRKGVHLRVMQWSSIRRTREMDKEWPRGITVGGIIIVTRLFSADNKAECIHQWQNKLFIEA